MLSSLREGDIMEGKVKVFNFIAFNSSGERKLGTVKARSLPEAKKKIQKMGFYLASIETQDSSGSYGQGFFSFIMELFSING